MYHLLIAHADDRPMAAEILYSLHGSGFTSDDVQPEVATATGAVRIVIRVQGAVERRSTINLIHQSGGLVAKPTPSHRRHLLANVT